MNARRSTLRAMAALVFVLLWIAIALLLTGCASTADVQKPAPMYGPGGYKERNLIQRAPYAPLRR